MSFTLNNPVLRQTVFWSILLLVGASQACLAQSGPTQRPNMLGQAALGLGLAGAAPITRHIGDALGLEDFVVESEGQGVDTQVVASGSLTDKLSVRYGVGVFEPSNNLALRYELSRRLYLEAVSGFASSLDFFYRIDF